MLLVVGAFLPWFVRGGERVSGLGGAGTPGDGRITLGLGAAALVLASLAIATTRRVLPVLIVALGCMGVFVTLIDWALAPGILSLFESPTPHVRYGIFVSMTGAVLAVLGGVMLLRRPRPG